MTNSANIFYNPESLLKTHNRLRNSGFPIATILIGRRVVDGRALYCRWLISNKSKLIIVPDASIDGAEGALRYRVGQKLFERDKLSHNNATHGFSLNGLPSLLFLGELNRCLCAAYEFTKKHPEISVAIATTTDKVLETLLKKTTSSDMVRFALQGLVPAESIDDKIIAAIVEGRQLTPLLRSPYEGLIFYMLEVQPQTKGQFLPNQRVDRPKGGRPYEVDLLAAKAKLVIEIDGPQHDSTKQKAFDEKKQKDLEILGYEIRRFSTEQVALDPVGVWRLIDEQLHRALRDLRN